MESKGKKLFTVIATLIVWFAICLQFKLSLHRFNGDAEAALKLFLSYFTVISNIIVAICLTVLSVATKSAVGKFFSKPSVQTAITVYILMVAIIYNVALRGLVVVGGPDRLADELLHVVNPLLFFAYWIFFTDKTRLTYQSTAFWMVYPLLYVVFIIIRGEIINQYPYPFIDATKLGYTHALINAGIILIVFYLLSLIFVFVAKRMCRI